MATPQAIAEAALKLQQKNQRDAAAASRDSAIPTTSNPTDKINPNDPKYRGRDGFRLYMADRMAGFEQ
jgi:hypothetical protein